MSYVQAGTDANGNPINLFYQDLGTGKPVVLIHGWPLDGEMWEYQLAELPKHGIRCIAYDRRGFGKSSKPWDGYDYDTLATDLKAILDELDLQDVTLVGFSMGGGEVARYMSRYSGARVSKVVFISAVTPYLLKTEDNPDGVDQSTEEEMISGLEKDRADFLSTFGKQFYGVNLINHPVTQPRLDWNLSVAMLATVRATVACAKSFWETDFRSDLTTISVPTLIIHGDSDKTVPFESSGQLTHEAIPQSQLLVYEGEPHGLFFTSKDQLNQDLIAFIGTRSTVTEPAY